MCCRAAVIAVIRPTLGQGVITTSAGTSTWLTPCTTPFVATTSPRVTLAPSIVMFILRTTALMVVPSNVVYVPVETSVLRTAPFTTW